MAPAAQWEASLIYPNAGSVVTMGQSIEQTARVTMRLWDVEGKEVRSVPR